jgi:type IV secretory pathway VirB10-like protein
VTEVAVTHEDETGIRVLFASSGYSLLYQGTTCSRRARASPRQKVVVLKEAVKEVVMDINLRKQVMEEVKEKKKKKEMEKEKEKGKESDEKGNNTGEAVAAGENEEAAPVEQAEAARKHKAKANATSTAVTRAVWIKKGTIFK